MSLQAAANHLAAHGRGPDDHLVHMSGKEVAGLQALAQAHGGSLTKNPHTGLPEAGFLDSMLPTIIGMALAPETGGASLGLTEGWMAPALVGGVSALTTGSLQKGLMAGLGAYGGSQLMSGYTGESPGNLLNAPAPVSDAYPTTQVEPYATPSNSVGANLEKLPASAPAAPPISVETQFPTQVTPGFEKFTPSLSGSTTTPTSFAVTPENFNPDFGYGKPGDVSFGQKGGQGLWDTIKRNATLKNVGMAAAPMVAYAMNRNLAPPTAPVDRSLGPRYRYESGLANPFPKSNAGGPEQKYFPDARYVRISDAEAKNLYGFADGGMAYGGDTQGDPNLMQVKTYDPVVRMASGGAPQSQADQALSGGTKYDLIDTGGNTSDVPAPDPNAPLDVDSAISLGLSALGGFGSLAAGMVGQALGISGTGIANSIVSSLSDSQGSPDSTPAIGDSAPSSPGDGGGDGGSPATSSAAGGLMHLRTGGISDLHYNLGGYSDGGRLLKGPGDGVSDSIPAMIGQKQPARLADGEFVVPARIVSELGNGSTEAGARQLYAMMDRVQKARGKTTGKKQVAKNTNASKFLPA